jgi:hypothetical protein
VFIAWGSSANFSFIAFRKSFCVLSIFAFAMIMPPLA